MIWILPSTVPQALKGWAWQDMWTNKLLSSKTNPHDYFSSSSLRFLPKQMGLLAALTVDFLRVECIGSQKKTFGGPSERLGAYVLARLLSRSLSKHASLCLGKSRKISTYKGVGKAQVHSTFPKLPIYLHYFLSGDNCHSQLDVFVFTQKWIPQKNYSIESLIRSLRW